MPVIELHGLKLTKDQKESIIKEMTDVACKVTKVPKETIIVMINEKDPDNLGIGGKSISEMLKK